MPTKRVIAYSFGDVANNLTFQMTSMFLMVYMTDIAGVAAGTAGLIYGVTKIWAGFSDLFAGQMVDRADTRWGRLRPWILFGSTPLAVVFVLLFSAPAGLTPAATVAWIFLFDAAYQLAYSFVNIPYGSLGAAMTQNSVDRSRLSGARSIASAMTGVALSAIVAPQFQDTSGDDVRMRFTLICAGLGVIAVILYLICFANVREVVPRSTKKVSLGATLKMVRQNKPLVILCAGAFFLLCSMFTMSAVAMYYAREVLGNAGWYTLLALAQTLGTVAVASFVPTITIRFGKRNGYVLSAAVVILAFVLIYFVPAGSLPVAIVAWLLFGIGTGGTNALMFSMQADTVDYGEWKTELRSEGGSYSILSFIRKTGQGVGGWAGAFIIGLFGYAGGAAEQTAEAVQGIRLATGALPAVLALLALLVMLRYPLSGDEHKKIVSELHERRTTQAVKDAHGVDTGEIKVREDVGDGRSMRVRAPSKAHLPIVTLFEATGSGGSEIGPKLAEKLGVPFIPQAFSLDDISTAKASTYASDSAFNRWLRGISFGVTTDADHARGTDQASNTALQVENTRSVIAEVENGGVLVGRNGALVLAKAEGAFHVRLYAPLEKRIARIAETRGLSWDDAAELIVASDRTRAEISQRVHRWDPNSDEHYDIEINTTSMTYDDVVDLIVGIYRKKYPETGLAE